MDACLLRENNKHDEREGNTFSWMAFFLRVLIAYLTEMSAHRCPCRFDHLLSVTNGSNRTFDRVQCVDQDRSLIVDDVIAGSDMLEGIRSRAMKANRAREKRAT